MPSLSLVSGRGVVIYWLGVRAGNQRVESERMLRDWTRHGTLIVAVLLAAAPAASAIGTWTELAPLPFRNSEFGAAVIDGRIYSAGGFLHLDRLVIYDPATDSWSEGPDLPFGTHHAGVVSEGGKLYVIGGEGTSSSKVQIFDPATETWNQGAPLITPRGALAAVVLDGKIHAIGGGPDINSGTAWDNHEVYDPATDSWEVRAPLLLLGEHIFGAAIDGKIYVAGGRDGFSNQRSLQVYDPATDSWSPGANMRNKRSGHAVAALKGKLYTFGGENLEDFTVLAEAERYDPKANTWESLTDVPVALHGVASAVVDGSIYLIGGAEIAASGLGSRHLLRLDLPSVRPARPGNLRAVRTKRKRVRLGWDDESDNEEIFVIQMKGPDDRKFQTIKQVGADATRTWIQGLDPGATYRFRVRARAGNKKSRVSNTIEVTTRG